MPSLQIDQLNGGTAATTIDDADYGLIKQGSTNKPFQFSTLKDYIVTGIVVDAINNGTTDSAPSQNAVFDALALKAPLASPTFTGTVSGITAAMVGLGNVNNTSDANKPVSTATQTALDLKANLASPTFTGTPAAPTPTAGTSTTQIATTAFVRTPGVQSVTSSATVTATAADDIVKITAQAAGLTLANPTGTWAEGQGLVYRIKDNGTARSISYGAKFRAIGVTAPTTTVISKTLYIGVIYNSTDDKFDIVSTAQEA